MARPRRPLVCGGLTPAAVKVVSAYLLAVLGGKEAPSADDIKKILSSVGAEADDVKIEKLVASMAGKSVADVITAGSAKLASVPSGGGGGGAAAAPAAAGKGGAPAAGKKEEPKKEEKKPEPEEEDDADMGFSLFD